MTVLLPSKILVPYVEAYYISPYQKQNSPVVRFSATSTSYIKLSPVSAIVSGQATNRVIKLDQILGHTATELTERVIEETSPLGQVRCLERTLTRLIEKSYDSSDLIGPQAIAILRQLPTTPISKLAEELGYSSRQLQRRLDHSVGLSPRLLKRISRFEQALELVQVLSQHGDINWSTIALACGYSDQAHFIREFHEFSGSTPTLYLSSLRAN
jgi:AraC-like DNA-binding protein